MRTMIMAVCLVGLVGEAGAQTTEWTLRPGAFSVGGSTADDRYILSRVVGAQRLADGRVVIADRYAQGMRMYDSEGRYLAKVGGKGGGPEEFQSIRALGRCDGDHIVAFDLSWTRKIYDQDLGFLGSHLSSIPGLVRGAYQLACEPGGTIVATGWGDVDVQHRVGSYTATAPVVLVREGEVVHEFGERVSSVRVGLPPHPQAQTDPHYGGGSNSIPHPFGRQTSLAIAGDRVYLGNGSEYELDVFGLTGDPLPPIRWSGPNLDILDRHLELYEGEMVASVSAERRPAMRRAIQGLPRLARFPAYDVLMVDRVGRLWVRSFVKPGEAEVTWTIFGPAGDLVGILPLAKSQELLEAGEGYVLINQADELDVETVRLMELVTS